MKKFSLFLSAMLFSLISFAVAPTHHSAEAAQSAEMVGVVKRALQYYDATIVLTHEANGVAHIYNVIDGVATEVSQEGVIAVDPENKGSYLAISDIALTEDGKLVANNYVRCQFAGTAPEDGYKLGTSYYYIWDDLTGAPRVWFTSQATARSSHGDMGKTFAVKGTSTDAKVLVTAVHNNNRAVRMALYSIIDGVYEEPNIAGGTYNNDYYFNFGLHTKANYYKEETQGKEFYLLASPLAENSWIIEGELSEPSEFLVPAEIGADYTANQEIAANTLGNIYQGTSIVTVGEQVLMVAPYATAEGLLAGVKVLDITDGLAAAVEVNVLDLDAPVEATAAATAVQVVEGGLVVNLVADATIYTLNVELSSTPSYDLELPVEISNLTTDLMTVGDLSFLQLNGSNDMEGVEVMLFIPDYTGEDKEYALDLGNYYLTLGGTELTLVEGALTQITDPEKGATYAGRVVATAEEDGQLMTVAMDLTMYSIPPVEIEIEDVTITVDEESAIAIFAADWEGAPLQVEVSGFENAEFMEYEECWLSIGDDNVWVDAAVGPVAVIIEDGLAMLEGEFTSYATGKSYYVTLTGNMPGAVEPVEMVGVVKRALQYYDATILLTHEADGTAHIYNVVDGVVAEVSQEGVIARDPENAGDLLAISDIALTEDGKLVAVNYMVCQAGDDYVDEGYKKGENRFYIWNSLDEAPSVWFKSNMYANWFRSNNGYTMAVKGTSTNASIALSGYHATKSWARIATYKVIDGVYTEPADAATGNDNYTWCEGPESGVVIDDNVIGANYELNASPLAAENWIVDGNLVDPIEYVAPADIKAIISTLTPLSADLGKKYNGATYVTVGEQHFMVAPYATAEGLLAGVKVLDITAGLAAAVEVNVLDLDAPVEATAAATAVQVVENGLNINLVADATIYPLTTVAEGPEYMVIEDNVTNLIIDLESMAIIGGPSTMWQVEVFLGIGEEDGNGKFALTEESSVAIMGFDARFIDGYAYDIDVNAPAAKVVLHVEDSGFFYEIRLDMTSAAPADPIAVVVENATVTIDTIPLFGDAVDYALTMTADWTYAEDGVTYPVLVEVPVYYPEATEPSEITCTVTIGGMGDDDPWLGFGEGTLTITTVDGVVTAKGLVSNPYTGVAFDVTVSGKLPQGSGTGIDNVQVEVKALKTIKNGQLIIVRDGKEFNAQGAVVK